MASAEYVSRWGAVCGSKEGGGGERPVSTVPTGKATNPKREAAERR